MKKELKLLSGILAAMVLLGVVLAFFLTSAIWLLLLLLPRLQNNELCRSNIHRK